MAGSNKQFQSSSGRILKITACKHFPFQQSSLFVHGVSFRTINHKVHVQEFLLQVTQKFLHQKAVHVKTRSIKKDLFSWVIYNLKVSE